jgi:prophage tail gpP-like protein
MALPDHLWRAGETVVLEAPSLGLRDRLLIVDAHYTLDARGTLTDLRLAPLTAYDPEPPPPDPHAPDPDPAPTWWT